MNTSRREFIKKSALATIGISLASQQGFSFIKGRPQLSIQLYTVRDEMKQDPLGTLKQIAAIGYKNVEHASYVDRKFYGYTAKEFKTLLSDLGLNMPSGHTVMAKKHWDEAKNDFSDAWKYTVEDAAILGQQYVISPSMDASIYQTEDLLKHFCEIFNKSGELCKKSGMKFGYHNHDFEFSKKINDKMVYELIMDNTDRNLVVQQLDTGNLFNGGAKAIDIIKKYPGRFELLHVKDEIEAKSGNDKYESTILGKGIAQLKEILDLTKSDVKFLVVEQEAYQDKTPIDCAKEDFNVMRGWGF
ncbi:sugar phosphate isomerase [Cytophagales bacterium WSM2-2]|nr:sugar phosphate isomerase [Cytophagales bacterium WSM2-2]